MRLRHRGQTRRLLKRDKTPLAILLMVVVVGTVTGLVGMVFKKAVTWVQNQRIGTLAQVADHDILLWPLAFILSASLAMVGHFLVRKFAPEAGGPGIPEIEGALEKLRFVRWWRVLPVRFVNDMGTPGASMVLRREGPTVQINDNLGHMVLNIFHIHSTEARHTLLATGAAAGPSTAFNAPLVGILSTIGKIRPQLHYNLVSVKAMPTGVIMSSIVFHVFNSGAPIVEAGKLSNAPVNTLWLYLVLGLIFGRVGPLFSTMVLRAQSMFQHFHGDEIKRRVLIGGAIDGLCGILGLIQPEATGGGFDLIPITTAGDFSVDLPLFISITRVVTTLLCFSSGAPGGIFAPMLALGTLFGAAFGIAAATSFLRHHLEVETFAITGMGVSLAALVHVPLTGVVLMLETTDNYQLILSTTITCPGATLLAQFMDGKPLCSTILAHMLARREAEQAVKGQSTAAGENV